MFLALLRRERSLFKIFIDFVFEELMIIEIVVCCLTVIILGNRYSD